MGNYQSGSNPKSKPHNFKQRKFNIKMFTVVTKIRWNSVWYPRAEGEYLRKDRLGQGVLRFGFGPC